MAHSKRTHRQGRPGTPSRYIGYVGTTPGGYGFRPREVDAPKPNTRLNSGEGFKWTPRRVGAAVAIATVLSVPVAMRVIELFNEQRKLSEIPTMPDATTEAGKQALQEGYEEGIYTIVRIDRNHKDISAVADAITTGNYGPMSNSLIGENGGTPNVIMGQEFYVPSSELAQKLHDEQYGVESEATLPDNR